MEKPSVSVVIPVYNEEKYINECLYSLFAQTLLPLEIIVVDDGSTDDSKLKMKNEKRQLKMKNLILLNQNHKGPSVARNLGAKKARGDILVFVDGDMRFDKKYLEKLVGPIVKGEAVATFTKEEYVANPENIWSSCWSIQSGWDKNLHIDPDMPDEVTNFRAILKSVFTKTKGYKSVGYGEDVTVLAQLKGIMAKKAEGAICYHFNPSTLTEVFTSARWMGRGEGFKKNLTAILTFSFLNSARKGIGESFKHHMPQFFLFKLVFDLGVFIGIFERLIFNIHKK